MENEESGEGIEGRIFGVDVNQVMGFVKLAVDNVGASKELISIVKPVATEVVELALNTVGPEVHRVVERISIGTAKVRKSVFDQYIEDGFSREEAMALLLADIGNVRKASKNLGSGMGSAASSASKK